MRRRSGQALVEFALAISVFMLLVLGTFDLARAYLTYTVITNAAREVARYGAAHASDVGWETAATQVGVNMSVGVDAARITWVTPVKATIGGLPYIVVSAAYPFHSITPLVGALLGDPITIQVDTSELAG